MRLLRPDRRLLPSLPFGMLAAVLLLQSCNATPIKSLLDDPAKYEGEKVRVAGEVKGSFGVLGVGAYRIDDGTGTIAVVTEGGGAPRDGAMVGVEGTFRSAFTLGSQSVAVIVESKRATK